MCAACSVTGIRWDHRVWGCFVVGDRVGSSVSCAVLSSDWDQVCAALSGDWDRLCAAQGWGSSGINRVWGPLPGGGSHGIECVRPFPGTGIERDQLCRGLFRGGGSTGIEDAAVQSYDPPGLHRRRPSGWTTMGWGSRTPEVSGPRAHGSVVPEWGPLLGASQAWCLGTLPGDLAGVGRRVRFFKQVGAPPSLPRARLLS